MKTLTPLLAATALGCAAPNGALPGDADRLGTASVETPSGIRIHALETGWVRIKRLHRELVGPAALRIPGILLDPRWAEWMPVISYAVEHEDRVIVVDAGVDPASADPAWFDVDPGNAFFYRRNLRFQAAEPARLGARLREVGLDPSAVDSVLVTHFHADHVGGLGDVPNATVLVGPGNWPGHLGAFTAHLGDDFAPKVATWGDGPHGAFADSQSLTSDGLVRVVPLPGHTPGHAGLLIRDAGRAWLLAGDATFDLDQTERGAVSGVSEDVAQARATQALIRAQRKREPTTLLPAHDPGAFEALPASAAP